MAAAAAAAAEAEVEEAVVAVADLAAEKAVLVFREAVEAPVEAVAVAAAAGTKR